MYIAAIAITIVSNVLYHIIQKLMPVDVHPMMVLISAYLLAALLCLLLFPLFPLQGTLMEELRRISPLSGLLAFAIVGLEAGFLLAYRAGWRINMASLVSNTTVAVILVGVGLTWFRERPSALNMLGILVCVLGLIMVNWEG